MTSAQATARENRLARESSPYLLQHKHNPVDWWPWGTEVLAEAKHANKPILLSVGYAACHWCHVMAHDIALRKACLRRPAARGRTRVSPGSAKRRAEPQRADGAPFRTRPAAGPRRDRRGGARPRRQSDRRHDRFGARRHARRAEISAT